ncbi:ATP-dependent DNA ligase [Acidianus sulfidivorans JP7]|uniref:DNA ligase n=1 Tax=Acidianus sulfidivorans JP7 TaxID=619593 RepID=A0A2U9IMV7_9CREN|nr:ATP-dependent DNA ligase [Acidianus sulfidivorans]AWR97336.1 ATP-dependent DNA ligase [Acidianus sulfidivorans JP7]
MEFKIIAEYFDRLEKISSRIQLTSLLSDLFKNTDKNVIDKVVYLIQGKLWPDFLGMPELGIGDKFLIKALSIASGVSEEEIEKLFKNIGDLGEVAYQIKQKQQGSNILAFLGAQKSVALTVEEAYEDLTRISTSTGESSRDLKIRLLAGLLKKASPLEAKYLVRFIDGRLRVGIGDATILDALAITFAGGQNFRPYVERAYNLRADLGNIAKIIAFEGIEKIKDIKPQPGIPIRPMLAERLSDPAEILDKVGKTGLVDYKYDGERGQIHKHGDKISIFSRRLENITSQYPDVAEYISKFVKGSEFIIEGEIIPVDPDTGEMRPFQELMHRKRKNDIHEAIKEYPVNVMLFDLMYYDGEDYTVKPLPERRKKLESIISDNDKVHIADHIITDDVNKLKEFFYQAISDGAEGVMVKSIAQDSIYQAGSRGWLWIKFKRDYQSEMADTVDLVLVGAFYGKGKKGGKFSSFLMAAYNPDKDVFETVCKVASGFSDAELDDLQKKISELKRNEPHPRVVSSMIPDVWLTPSLVAEIIGAEITISPLHTCCKDQYGIGGLSVRFPRFIRWRPDKSPEDATTNTEILEMYKSQLKKIEENPSDKGT